MCRRIPFWGDVSLLADAKRRKDWDDLHQGLEQRAAVALLWFEVSRTPNIGVEQGTRMNLVRDKAVGCDIPSRGV